MSRFWFCFLVLSIMFCKVLCLKYGKYTLNGIKKKKNKLQEILWKQTSLSPDASDLDLRIRLEFIEMKKQNEEVSEKSRRRHGKVLVLHISSPVVSGSVSASTCVGERPRPCSLPSLLHSRLHWQIMAIIISHIDEDHQCMK